MTEYNDQETAGDVLIDVLNGNVVGATDNEKTLSTMIRLMGATHRETASVTNSLIESYQRSLAERDAELSIIRGEVDRLLSGEYAPSEAAIVRAVFYPNRQRIQELAEDALQREEY